MKDDKSFTVYALILVAGVVSVITASVQAGFASLPSPLVFLEHVALPLMMRASYKTIGGFDWADWSVTRETASEAAAATGLFTPAGPTANAEG